MERLAELALALVPLLAFLAWRRLSFEPAPSPMLIWALALTTVLIGAVLVLHALSGEGPSRYRPAELRDGQIVPGEMLPR